MPRTLIQRDLPLVARARAHGDRVAVVADAGLYTYRDLLGVSARGARELLDRAAGHGAEAPGPGPSDLNGAPVAYLVPRDFAYPAVQWSVWRAGGMGVPLATSHPARELAHVLDDAGPVAAVAHPSLAERLAPLVRERALPLLSTDEMLESDADGDETAGRPSLPAIEGERQALMLYTSGTTGRPKGVVHTHDSIRAQVEALVEAWAWGPDDHILLVLPLHHVHGIVNVLTCALWSGARCQILPAFDAGTVWERFGRGDLTLFMAVPTVYHKLIGAWEDADEKTRRRWSEGARSLRLMVSGSAALPVPVLKRWREITDHTLLERYGMTEIGMALSNPLEESGRRPGHVGRPLPGVELRLVDDDGRRVEADTPGEIEVRGPTLFREYWNRPDATAGAFTDDGWFRTGDEAVLEEGHYRILGRRSVDILKTGGYKVSALEVETVLRAHGGVDACAVVGVPDPEWGQRVAAAVVLRPGAELDPEALRAWARERLAPYKAPTLFELVDALPRNAMGKVTKPDVVALFAEGAE